MKVFFFLFALSFIISCSQDNCSKGKRQLIFTDNDSTILNSWIVSVIKNNPRINSQMIELSKINNFKNYLNKLPADSFKTKIEYDLRNRLPKIFSTINVITLDFSNEDVIKFFILKDKFIYSYHHSMGNNGHSVIYDLIKQKDTVFYCIDSLSNNIAYVNRERYGLYEKNMMGHFWQRGTWDLNTGKIIWGKWEN